MTAAWITFLAISIGCLVLGLRQSLVGRRHALLAFTWLSAAIASTIVVFSFFPAATADGSALGISLTGAAAFVVVVVLLCVRVQKQMSVLDDAELRSRAANDRVAELTGEVATLRQRFAPQPLEGRVVHRYDLGKASRQRLGIVTGDLSNVDFADIWVNSENVDMQMSRFHEKSVSGMIRYEGAEHDDTGRVTNDLVADELAGKVAGRTPVTAGTAIVTSAGRLAEKNRVRHIIHSAAVQGEPGSGYRQVRGLDRCVREVLRTAEQLGGGSIIFPLLGTGAGGAEPAATARAIIGAAVEYLRATPDSTISTVYFLAYTDWELSACQDAAHAIGLRPSR